MKRLAFMIACLFAALSASGEEPLPRYGNELDCGVCSVMEIDRLTALLGDEALRELVCRLSSERYTLRTLSSALGMPQGQVLRRINTLRGWGLVRMVRLDSANTIVEPIPGGGEQTLRRWAYKYCPQGDACGIPGANVEETRPTEKALGGGVASSFASGGLKGKLVTVFGGSGFIGRELVKRLITAGARVRVASRKPHPGRTPRGLGKDSQIELMAVNIRDEAKIKEAVAGAHMVVNLIGILNESDEQEFGAIHVDGARAIAKAAAEAKAERFVQVSSIAANSLSPSHYAQSKSAGEGAVEDEFEGLTIVRPSVVFGPEDGFFNRLASLSRHTPFLPLLGGGKTRYQPVYVGDVGAAIIRILEDPGTKNHTYELGGPRKMTMREIFSLVSKESGHPRPLVSLPMWVANIPAEILQRLPNPLITRDSLKLLGRDAVVGPGALGLEDLGITPTPFEDVVPKYLGRDHRGDKFAPEY